MSQSPSNAEYFFELKDKQKNVHKYSFDDVGYLIGSTILGFPRLTPESLPTAEERQDPEWIRMMAKELTKFIPELAKAFKAEFDADFSGGTLTKLFNEYNVYSEKLKKNTVGSTSSAPSTDSTATTSPPSNTTIS
jgi:hypothetical protein